MNGKEQLTADLRALFARLGELGYLDGYGVAEGMKTLDPVEQDYRAINEAAGHGDNDRAYELSVGLREYREQYKAG